MTNSSGVSSSCSVAFKEWACLVEALGAGAQSLMVRKGGIHERNGVFEPEYSVFFLFPTTEHQKNEDLNTQGRDWFEKSSLKKESSESDSVRIEYLAQSRQVFWVSRSEWLQSLAEWQFLNIKALEKRFNYGERLGFYLMHVRVFRLKNPFSLPLLPAYRGCKSWISLPNPQELSDLEPVLSESEFMRQGDRLRDLLGT